MSDIDRLVEAARAEFAVPAASTLADVYDLLTGWGAEMLPVDSVLSKLADEFVDQSQVASAWMLDDAALLAARASAAEEEMFAPIPGEVFDPYEYGPENVWWTTIMHEVETMRRLILFVERVSEHDDRVGNFRVYGAGQWLRESLWAATGVLPRDPGSVGEGLFLKALRLAGRSA